MGKTCNKENTLERIISFIGSCDEKANILLAFVGVILTVLFTSGLFSKFQNLIISPFLDYWKNGNGTFCFDRFLLFLSMSGVLVCAGYAIYYLIKVVRPQLDNKGTFSRIYFGHIATMSYDEFKKVPQEYNYDEDLLQQIHVNSQICTRKYNNLRKAINSIIGMIVSCFIMYVLLLFM